MDKKEIEIIKSMVIHGCYKVCITNGYNPKMFEKLKAEQKRVFDNYILNKSILEEREKNLLEDWENEIMRNCSTCAYPTENCGKFTCNCGDSDMYEKEIAGDTTCDCWEENC